MNSKRLRRAFFAFCIGKALALIAAATPIPVTISSPTAGQAGVARTATLTFQPLEKDGRDAPAPARKVPAQVPGTMEVDLLEGFRYRAELIGEGLWAAPRIVDLGKGEPLTFEARPGGRIHVPLVLPRGEAPLAVIALRIQMAQASRREKPWEAATTCPVAEGGVDCPVPAGRLDLRLRSDAHIPAYLWDVAVRPGGISRLPPVSLQRGASLSGWVSTQDGNPPGDRCQIELVPETAAVTEGPAADPRLRGLRLLAKPNARGFFQIQGVPVGRYRVSASRPGAAKVSVGPLDVRAGLEAQLSEPLVLTAPIQFRISVAPPVDAFGKPWRILLSRRASPSETPKEEWSDRFDGEGIWRTPPLSSDTYEIQIRDERSGWLTASLEVEPGEPDLHLQIDLVEIAGLLRLGREPLAAEILLNQKGRTLHFQSDENGHFAGFLPETGSWGAVIKEQAKGLDLAIDDPVEVQIPKGKRRATVEIVIPNTRISGEVVDESGKPVPKATVSALRSDREGRLSRIATGPEGRFDFQGLPEGAFSLHAQEGDRESETRPLLLAEEEAQSDLKLVLRSSRKISGQVVSSTGAVPGAQLFAYWAYSGLGGSSGQQAQSGPDGRFQFQAAGNPPSVSLLVMAPGYAFHMESALLLPGQDLEVQLEATGGELTLELDGASPVPVLVKDGTFLPLQMLDLWSRMNGAPRPNEGRKVVPQMEAGAYSLCRGAGAISTLKEGQAPPAAHCASGVLAPAGQLTLSAPAVPAPPAGN